MCYCWNCGTPFDFWKDNYCFKCGVKLHLGTIEGLKEFARHKQEEIEWMSPHPKEVAEFFNNHAITRMKQRIEEHAKLPESVKKQ